MGKEKQAGTFQDLISGETPVLIDFYADWCGPCKMMPPILSELKNMCGERLRIVKIDTEANAQLSSQLGIRSIPTLALFAGGKELWRQAGVMDAHRLYAAIKDKLPA